MRRVLPAALAVAALLLAPGAAGRPATSPTLRFSFEGYANNVRVLPPLVGKWQLGVGRIHGQGVFAPGRVSGTLTDTDDPKLSRYEPRSLRARIVGGNWTIAAHNVSRTLVLTVEITSSSHPDDECAPGLRGRLTLFDTDAKLSNGQVDDVIVLGKWAGKCNTHVHGWSNVDNPRTDPTSGGRGGGNWADVRVKVS